MSELKLPLTNVQLELMKLYSTNLSDSELDELRNVLSKFYAEKAITMADRIWDECKLTDEDMDNSLNQTSRKTAMNKRAKFLSPL